MRDAAHLCVLPGSHYTPGGQPGCLVGSASQQKVCCHMHLANQSVSVSVHCMHSLIMLLSLSLISARDQGPLLLPDIVETNDKLQLARAL